MPLNNEKIFSIISEQCVGIDERCNGYRGKLIETIYTILEYEQEHRQSATNIQKKINSKCDTVARFLAEQRAQTTAIEELD